MPETDKILVTPASHAVGAEVDGVDLSAVADALGRPVLVDADAHLVAIGAATTHRQQAMGDRRAPDAAVFNLQGDRRQLSEWSGTRRLLVAFSTW